MEGTCTMCFAMALRSDRSPRAAQLCVSIIARIANRMSELVCPLSSIKCGTYPIDCSIYLNSRHMYTALTAGLTAGQRTRWSTQAWSRTFAFHQKVRDVDFWSQSETKRKLNATLSFLSGDREFAFEFEAGHQTPPTGLFDFKGVSLTRERASQIVLFSGGLDSLTGVYDLLANTEDDLWLVSHRSSQPQTGHTQDRLVKALNQRFPRRIQHYKFHCNLVRQRAVEETQRTRMFLYATIAFVISATCGQNAISIFENGITSVNFPRRQDLLNARATRTSHPKTISLLRDLFRHVGSQEMNIATPFFWLTKTDVVAQLGASGGGELIPSSVSCSRTFLPIGSASHCGQCSQCVDRRFACYAAGFARDR